MLCFSFFNPPKLDVKVVSVGVLNIYRGMFLKYIVYGKMKDRYYTPD